jgi:hypothetical protein
MTVIRAYYTGDETTVSGLFVIIWDYGLIVSGIPEQCHVYIAFTYYYQTVNLLLNGGIMKRIMIAICLLSLIACASAPIRTTNLTANPCLEASECSDCNVWSDVFDIIAHEVIWRAVFK